MSWVYLSLLERLIRASKFRVQVAGGDSWLQFFATNTSFFISDEDGQTLYSSGLQCPNSPNHYMCIQTLKDGAYVLRVGNGYGQGKRTSSGGGGLQFYSSRMYYDNEGIAGSVNYGNRWRFCNQEGHTLEYLRFNLSYGECLPYWWT